MNKIIELSQEQGERHWPKKEYPTKGRFMTYAPTFVLVTGILFLGLSVIMGVIIAIKEDIAFGIFITLLSLLSLIAVLSFLSKVEKTMTLTQNFSNTFE